MKHGVDGHQAICGGVDHFERESAQTEDSEPSTNLLVSLRIFADRMYCSLDLANKPVGGEKTPLAIPFRRLLILPQRR